MGLKGSLRSWGLSSTPTIKCWRLPLSTLGENEEITSFRGLFCRGPFEATEFPTQVREGAFKTREWLPRNKVGKQRLVFVFGRGPFYQAPASMAHFISTAEAFAAPLLNRVCFSLKHLPSASESCQTVHCQRLPVWWGPLSDSRAVGMLAE